MSDEPTAGTTTPGRGSAESAAWFRDKLAVLGISQGALARLMLEHGDDRQKATILRSLSRMASGEARVSGEMRALLGMLEQTGRASAADPRLLRDAPDSDGAAIVQVQVCADTPGTLDHMGDKGARGGG